MAQIGFKLLPVQHAGIVAATCCWVTEAATRTFFLVIYWLGEI
jgi:hypothetical protein